MTVIQSMQEDVLAQDIAVTIVDTDVHPLPVSGEVLKSYAPSEWKDKLWPTGNAVSPVPHFYDTPDSYKTNSLRVDASPPGGGAAGSDPDFAAKQLLVDAGVSIAVLEPMCDAQLPQAEHVLKATHNDWLADVWLGDNNWHGRWRGAISVTAQDPDQAAREIERWAGHPYLAEVLMTPQTRGIPFGSPHFDPLYKAAARNGLPVATHLMGQTPFELIPIYPVGNPAHWHDFFASWPLLYVSHLMSLVFDGAFDRHPELRVVFVEGGFTWAMPVMSRMDRIWEHRKADLPHVRRRPSDYVREHVRFTTQPLEEVNVGVYREYIEMMDLGDNIMFSTDYPHWSYDAPDWAIRRFPAEQRERIMRGNATALYGLPSTVKALPENGLAPVTPRSDDDVVESALTDLVRDYDTQWSSLDFVGLADLWVREQPQPIYVGDEYATPLIGNDELDRHWARVAGRLKAASVSSTLHEFDVVDDTVVRALLLSRWKLTSRESDIERTGASWVTWLLIRRGQRYRIFHQMESQVYLTEDEGK